MDNGFARQGTFTKDNSLEIVDLSAILQFICCVLKVCGQDFGNFQ